jgi:hypothetical protein
MRAQHSHPPASQVHHTQLALQHCAIRAAACHLDGDDAVAPAALRVHAGGCMQEIGTYTTPHSMLPVECWLRGCMHTCEPTHCRHSGPSHNTAHGLQQDTSDRGVVACEECVACKNTVVVLPGPTHQAPVAHLPLCAVPGPTASRSPAGTRHPHTPQWHLFRVPTYTSLCAVSMLATNHVEATN